MSAERPLGVIEAILAVRDQCPRAAARNYAAQALEAVKQGGADVMREQVGLVLATIAGWRGDRALAVHRALQGFLTQTKADDTAPPST
jgi:hypothetical protein